jgi:hypothetical protein
MVLQVAHQVLDRFLHGFAGLYEWTQMAKSPCADEPDAYSALKVGPAMLPDQRR